MAGLHRLVVERVERLTDDAVALTFEVPEDARESFAFAAGQHVALVRPDGGDGERRSYSICSPVGGPLRVAIKRLPGGVFSGWVHESLAAGDVLDVTAPSGRFGAAASGARDGVASDGSASDGAAVRGVHYAALAAGSGITPVLSILHTVLEREPASRCTLVYGNRTVHSIMFLEELEDLKNRYPERLALVHTLSRESQPAPLGEGRIDAEKVERLLDTVLPAETVDEWLLCGPGAMVDAVRSTLRARGVDGARIHRELFHADGAPAAPAPRPKPSAVAARSGAGGDGSGAAVTIVLDGRRTELTVPFDGAAILDAALAARPDAPYACKGGVCGTCRCRLLEGEVHMDHRYALEDEEISAGVRLACQSHPVSERVVLDFDAA